MSQVLQKLRTQKLLSFTLVVFTLAVGIVIGTLISVNTGGPLKYTGKEMKPEHAGMKITSSEFDAFLGVIEATLKKEKFKVAEADAKELIAILASARPDIVENKN